jgi:hypothetical protein
MGGSGSSQPQQRPPAKGEGGGQVDPRPPAKDAAGNRIVAGAADRAIADKAAADKAAADKTIADKAAADKTAADKVISDKATADKAIADKAMADALVPAQTMQNATPSQPGAYAPVSAAKTANPMAPQAPTASMPQQVPAEMNKSVAAAAAAQANKISTGANQFTTPSLNGITFGGS